MQQTKIYKRLLNIFLFLISFLLVVHAAPDRFDCDILDAECRERINREGAFSNGQRRHNNGENRCNYQDMWLIPGRADSSCSEFWVTKFNLNVSSKAKFKTTC